MFEDLLPHEFYKHKEVLNLVATVTGRCFTKFPKLQETKIRDNAALKAVFEAMYGLAGNIDVMVGEKQHTNPENNFTLYMAKLKTQISGLNQQLIKLSKAAIVIVTITQADLMLHEMHPLSIGTEKTVFSTIKNDN